MCTHGRYIANPYTKEKLFVKCGHCRACQMEKAASKYSRIMSHEAEQSYFRVFLTLKYSNYALPYIDMDEYEHHPSVFNVYRHFELTRTRTEKGFYKTSRVLGKFNIATLRSPLGWLKKFEETGYGRLQVPTNWNYESRAFGVCLASDFSDFMKRFKLNLKRYYGLSDRIGYFKVQEYGPTTFRPHFHAILSFPPEWRQHYFHIRRAIIQAWPFCSVGELKKGISIAVSGQRYVSSYVNRPSDYPPFLEALSISQKTSFSHGYGFGRSAFSSTSILSCIERQDYTYNYECLVEGRPTTVVAPIPQYVIRRYFPTFKGRCRLDDRALLSVLQSPLRLYAFKRYTLMDDEDVVHAVRLLNRARARTGLSPYDYALYYMRCLSGLFSYRMHVSMASVTTREGWNEYYTNNASVLYPIVRYGVMITDAFTDDYLIQMLQSWFNPLSDTKNEFSPNSFKYNQLDEKFKSEKYNEFAKTAKLNDYALSLDRDFIDYVPKKLNYGINPEKT